MTALLDVNVLFALGWAHHAHHEAAARWLKGHGDAEWSTCLFTQSAFLRLSMNPKVINAVISATDAITLLRKLTEVGNHRFLERSPQLTDDRFDAVWPTIAGYRQVTDATLLQIAAANQATVVTFDKRMLSISPEGVPVEELHSGEQ